MLLVERFDEKTRRDIIEGWTRGHGTLRSIAILHDYWHSSFLHIGRPSSLAAADDGHPGSCVAGG